jgi:hypothetical protein
MWIYKNKPFTEVPEGYVGFVYKITCVNKSNEYFGWNYFGLKHFYSKRTVKMGKKAIAALPDKRMSKKVKTIKEMDWQNYNSSNQILKDLIKKNPTHFKKEIIGLYETEKKLTYAELELLVKNDVLRDSKSWNANILSKFFRKDLI